jgi:hypothetical protein
MASIVKIIFVFFTASVGIGQLGIKLPNYNTNKAIWLPL